MSTVQMIRAQKQVNHLLYQENVQYLRQMCTGAESLVDMLLWLVVTLSGMTNLSSTVIVL